MGKDQATVSKWITNTTQPNLETMMQIARVLETQVDDLLLFDELPEVTYCIGNLSRRLGLTASEVYNRLKQSGILTGYIVPSYDVLHTFSKDYLMENLIEYMREKGEIWEEYKNKD